MVVDRTVMQRGPAASARVPPFAGRATSAVASSSSRSSSNLEPPKARNSESEHQFGPPIPRRIYTTRELLL